MPQQNKPESESLSLISRRTFFHGIGRRAIKLGLLGAAAASIGNESECPIVFTNDDTCGYCDGCGQDYDHCDGDYCDYGDYGDGCQYCDGSGQDYDAVGMEYCDYANYCDDGGPCSDNCGYCDSDGQNYDHCDGDYCDYANYADAEVV